MPPSNWAGLWTCCGGSLDSNLVLLPCVLVYNFHSWIDQVALICSLCSWWEGFGSSSLATLPLGFTCSFIFTSACGSSTGVCCWGCSGGFGSDTVGARCRGGTDAWVAVALASPGTQRSQWLGQQEISCSRRAWQPTPVFLPAWRIPRIEKLGRPQSTGSQSWTWSKWPHVQRWRNFSSFWQLCPREEHAWKWCSCLDHGDLGNAGYAGEPAAIVTGDMALLGLFLACGSSIPVMTEHEGGAASWVAGTLEAPSVPGHGLPQTQELWPYQSPFLDSATSFFCLQVFQASGSFAVRVGTSHQVAKVLELKHQSFQWLFRVDFLVVQRTSPPPQLESISSSVLSLLCGPTLTWLLEKQ